MPELVPSDNVLSGNQDVPTGSQSSSQIRSSHVQEVLGRIPPWTIRYGITAIAGVVVLLFALAAFVRYPESIAAEGILSNTDPPRDVVAMVAGRMTDLRMHDGDSVQAGDAMAFIVSEASPAAMDSVRQLMPVLERALDQRKDTLAVPPPLNLGAGASAWEALRSAHAQWQAWCADGYRAKLLTAQKARVAHQQQQIKVSERQHWIGGLKQVDRKLELGIDSNLFNKGFEPASELRVKRMAFYDQELGLIALESELQQDRITLVDQQAALAKMEQEELLRERELEQRYREAIAAVRTFMAGWERSNRIEAPVSGRVYQAQRLQTGQPGTAGAVLFRVMPAEAINNYRVECKLPVAGAGQVAVGQRAYISLEAYPALRHGKLAGIVQSISNIPTEGVYRCVVELPQGMRSTFSQELAYKPESKVGVELLTRDRSLLGRLFDRMRAANSP